MKNVKNWVIFALMAILSLGMSSCSTDSDNKLEAYKKVDEKTFKENIEASKRNGTPQIIDYRSAEEFAAGHIENAVNIPVTDRNAEARIKSELSQFDQSRNIYIYGSKTTNNTLGFYLAGIVSKEGWGLSKTFHLINGIEGWQEAGYPIVK
ncbi:MAG: rhodanese-like domain-containing protein [Paludibacteraceae bacterium]|nr:rhodanese-like domain-containing protein [Paludibacteraceae bacterium]MBR4839400.1 rhodanese-like domain-containing protein [Paludibacteraceae bacterium]